MKHSIALFDPLRGLVRVARMAGQGRWDCVGAEFRGARDGFFGRSHENEPLHRDPGSGESESASRKIAGSA